MKESLTKDLPLSFTPRAIVHSVISVGTDFVKKVSWHDLNLFLNKPLNPLVTIITI